MDAAIGNLVAANIAFVGSHFAMSHALRALHSEAVDGDDRLAVQDESVGLQCAAKAR